MRSNVEVLASQSQNGRLELGRVLHHGRESVSRLPLRCRREISRSRQQYLYEPYYDRLARGENDMGGRHAYSHVNSLSSAMQAYLTLNSEKHLRAAQNAFNMLLTQSFATGGWGPDEQLQTTGSDDVSASLTRTHHSFETPCGSYAHFKLTRYLLRVTRAARYGDSMERVMYNTVLGAKPLAADGQHVLLLRLQLQGKQVLPRRALALLFGNIAASSCRLSP